MVAILTMSGREIDRWPDSQLSHQGISNSISSLVLGMVTAALNLGRCGLGRLRSGMSRSGIMSGQRFRSMDAAWGVVCLKDFFLCVEGDSTRRGGGIHHSNTCVLSSQH